MRSIIGAIYRLFEKRATWLKGGSPQSPQYWVKKLFGAMETHSGIEIDEDKALTYSAVWAAINIISGAIGFLPLIVYQRGGDGETKTRLPKNPIYKLLHDRPNEYMDALTFRQTIQGHVLSWGNGYAEIERNGAGQPIALWPLLPNRTEPQVTETSRLRYKVSKKDGSTIYLPYRNVLHIKGLGFDGLKGYAVITYAANSLTVGMAAEKYGAKFFANNSNPSGVLEHPETLTDPAEKRLRESWETLHKGLDNAHRVAILEEGMKWHQIGITPEDAQFLETRKFSVCEVARWFDVPPHMLKDLERATFSNIEHQGIEFVTWTLLKWLKRWELECNYKLFNQAEQGVFFSEFLVDALLRGDTKMRYDAYRIGRMAGFLSINDIRKKENMNPIENGDTYLEPLNMKPVGTPFVPPVKKFSRTDITLRELLETTCERLITKEVNALRKAVRKPDTFKSRMDNFYGRHIEHVQTVLRPVINVSGREFDIETLAENYVNEHRDQINAVLEKNNNGDEIETLIDNLLSTWELSEAFRMTNKFLMEK